MKFVTTYINLTVQNNWQCKQSANFAGKRFESLDVYVNTGVKYNQHPLK